MYPFCISDESDVRKKIKKISVDLTRPFLWKRENQPSEIDPTRFENVKDKG